MGSFGENLRQQRETRGIALEDIAAATRISVRLLQAIENEQFDRLPGGVFNVNFVRQYARHVGLDEEAVVAEFRLLTAPATEAPAGHRPPEPNVRGTVPGNADYEWDRPRDWREWHGWKLATAGVVVLGLAGAAYLWLGRRNVAGPRSPEASSPSPPQQAAAPPPEPAGAPTESPSPQAQAPAEAKPPEPAPSKTAAVAEPAVAPARPVPDEGGPVRVEIQASALVWVSASADGRLRFETTLQPQQTRLIAAQSTVRLRVGDAAALTVTLNGQVQPPLGLKGHVKTVVLTAEGMQIVASSPPFPGSAPEISPEPQEGQKPNGDKR